MISEVIYMNGYGLYVWAAFVFTLLSFVTLYFVVKIQYIREEKKFITKFGKLNSENAAFAKSQSINKVILSNISKI